MEKLTDRQTEIFHFIQDHMEHTGLPPTRAEIAKNMGFRSANAAEDHLRALARKGVIELTPGMSRGIRFPKDPGLPIVGHVAAGQPILAEQHIERTVNIHKSFFHPTADYLLKVKGDSMVDGGIFDGDLLAVQITSQVHNGQIAVVRIDNEVTVKRFYKTEHIVTLRPQNPNYSSIVVDLQQKEKELAIEGLGVGIIREQLHSF